jgi:acetylglutamate kinase
MRAEKLIYLTDVDGLLADVDDPKSLVTRIDVDGLRSMIASGALRGGMIPKARACIDAVEAGVRSVHMVNGTLPHVLLLELFTDEGVGTMITSQG